MFRSPTLFVVGAGASCEVGLPSGAALRENIAKLLDIRFENGVRQQSGDYEVWQAISIAAKEAGHQAQVNAYRAAACQIAGAMTQAISIDNYIDAHRGNKMIEACGKIAIVRAILMAESQSAIYYGQDKHKPFNYAPPKAWFQLFFQRLTEGVARSEVKNVFENVAIVTFNYDRCIEHYLYHALQNYYGIGASEAASLMETLRIYHPYGVAGRLPWQAEGQPGVAFGDEGYAQTLLHLSKQIKTFTERVEEERFLDAIRSEVAQAETLIFLGFAYAEQNMELLTPPKHKVVEGGLTTRTRKVIGTASGISAADVKVVIEQIADFLDRIVRNDGPLGCQTNIRNDLYCAGLFEQYQRSMSR
ncbi:MAG TPA: hypothetical protein VGU45_11925 [Microvirga sp.]|jgi:hypothetical protein|nr:hypothetical protein [Microvirga sp.]